MATFREAWARLVAFFRKRELDRDFDEELRAHIALATEDYMKRGMTRAEAERLACVKFGSIESAKDSHRDSRGLPWLEGLFYDLRFAIRGLRRDRGFTAAAIAMLALAIGLNVTVYTVMEAMLFRGFPLVKKGHRLVYIQERSPSVWGVSYADFEDWRSQAHSLEAISFVGEKLVSFRDREGRTIDTSVFKISANTFGMLGVRPMLGRDFVEADELAVAAPVIILNYRFWDSRLGKRAGVIGMTVYVDGTPATIIGVMPARFDFPTQRDMWMPITRSAVLEQRGVTPGSFLAVGRLRDGASTREATAELETIERQLKAAYPATNRNLTFSYVLDDMHFHAGPNAPMIYGSLWAGACFVLLIACANLANLTLARTIGRWRDFSIRMALGAGQWRMIRQIFMEGILLASVAGMLGWWITKWSVHRWADATASRSQILDYTVDSGTLAYLVAVSIVAAMLFSLAPLGRVLQVQVSGVLKAEAGGVTQGLRGRGLSAVLITGQMALAIVLLSGAGVLVQSFLNVVDAPSGVRDPDHILVGRMRLPSDVYPNAEKSLGYFDQLETRLRAIPGIKDACVSTTIPLVRSGITRKFEIEVGTSGTAGAPTAQFLNVSAEYFRVVGVSATAGREFSQGDHSGSLPVAIVNQSFAAAFWPHGTPVGKSLRVLNRNQPGEWLTVVGVVPNIMQGDPIRQKFLPLVYLAFPQEAAAAAQRDAPLLGAYFLLRTEIPPKQLEHAVRIEVQKLDPDVSLEDFRTLKASFAFDGDWMDLEHMELGKDAAVAPAFALTALLLAAIGIYAVIAHSVGQRTKEIGVRMAIGAAAEDIRRMMLRDGMSPVVVGMILGLAASLGVNRIFESQLVGVSPYDPVTLTCGPLILVAVALLACQIPARRATRVDPAVALRNE